MKYRFNLRMSCIIVAFIILSGLMSGTVSASPCKDKYDDLSKAAFAVEQAQKEYGQKRTETIIKAIGATSSEMQKAMGDAGATVKHPLKRDVSVGDAAKSESQRLTAKAKLDKAKKALEDAKKALQDCLDKHKCPKCGILSNHLAASCETCDATGFYTCEHKCPNIPRCMSCNTEILTEQDKALHKQILCSCNSTYYLCNTSDANRHRPRICARYDGYLMNGQYYYMVDGMLYEGMRYCNSLYRECSNSTCTIDDLLEHTDYDSYDDACPVCSGITQLAEYCPIHD